MRIGLPVSTVDTDNYYTFNQYMLGYGGRVVNPDGTLNLSDQTRQAAIKTLTFIADAFKAGYIPHSALNWGDPDNNVAFFSKQIIMTNNATLVDSGRQVRRQAALLSRHRHARDADTPRTASR